MFDHEDIEYGAVLGDDLARRKAESEAKVRADEAILKRGEIIECVFVILLILGMGGYGLYCLIEMMIHTPWHS